VLRENKAAREIIVAALRRNNTTGIETILEIFSLQSLQTSS